MCNSTYMMYFLRLSIPLPLRKNLISKVIFVSKFIFVPLWVAMGNPTAQFPLTFSLAIFHFLGAKTFFSGSGPLVNRAMLVGAVQVGTYDQFREMFRGMGVTSQFSNVFSASMVSGEGKRLYWFCLCVCRYYFYIRM